MDYRKVDLHYLRAYAREIGVKSPSLYKKDLLIKKIKQVERGEVEPYFSKKGRPASKRPDLKVVKKSEDVYCKDSKEKRVLLFAIRRFKEFLGELEKEILEME